MAEREVYSDWMKSIPVTKSFMPPIENYIQYIGKIWNSNQLTNQGPLVQKIERKLKKLLQVKHFHFLTNGTLALQLALRALGTDGGEIITTPFSYVATTSAILWEGFKPVFVDISPDTLCIDPQKIEAAITRKTRAILAVHVFGIPCDVLAIKKIAKKHQLKVIYDGAHAFGSKYKDKSLLSYGDISICSFHATKLFHTIEGGCLITPNKSISKKVELMKRFGHEGDDHQSLGINAKGSEFQAAMGLCNLPFVQANIQKRKKIFSWYNKSLPSQVVTIQIPADTTYNYAYFPILLKDEKQLKRVTAALNKHNIFPRRYFYPSLNTLKYLSSKKSCPVSEKVSDSILSLPLYVSLAESSVLNICEILRSTLE